MQLITIFAFTLLGALLFGYLCYRNGKYEYNATGIFGGALAVLAGIAISSAMVFVPFGSADIITLNGALTDTVLQPGLNFKLPFVQGVWRMNTQVRALEIAHSSVFTKDQQNADNDYTINFSLQDKRLREIAENFRGDGSDTSISDRLIRPRAEYWLKQIEPTYNAADLLTHRSDVVAKLQASLQKDLSQYGVLIPFVSITNISFGPQYQQASEARAAAEQEYQKELTVLKTKQVIAKQNEAIAEGQANANARLRASLPSDPRSADAIVKMQMIQLLRDKWNGEMPKSMGGGSLLNISDTGPKP